MFSRLISIALPLVLVLHSGGLARAQFSEEQLAKWLARFPAADANKDGKLTVEEAEAFRKQRLGDRAPARRQSGAPRSFEVDPGWEAERFPEHAVCHLEPEEIAAILRAAGSKQPVVSYPKPKDGSLRIVGTGHSFMAPGYQTLGPIVRAAGFDQPQPLLHTGGGITGSTRYKWEQENGIFQFDRKPEPKLLASIANAEWDAMTWGPYFNDRPEFYTCWIDFCLKHNPGMTFYLSDAWPQLDDLATVPTTEAELTPELLARMGRAKREDFGKHVRTLNETYPGKVHIMPTCDAMTLAALAYHRGELPGVEGLHQFLGGKERSLWRDRLGHLGPGFGNLEGYVFYATLYGRSPELIEGDVDFRGAAGYPSRDLDRVFRRLAWKAVVDHPLSGVTDENANGIADDREPE